MNRAPLLALLLSLAWLAGAALGSFHLLAPVAAIALLSPAAWAVVRRPAPDARRLAGGLAAVGAAMACFLLFLHLPAASGAWGLLAELSVLAAGSVVIPLLYAATFGAAGRDGP